jgi:LemA protein
LIYYNLLNPMKRIIFNVVGFIAVAFSLSSCGYNGGVQKEEAVNAAWGQVENVYQRRADLIPNLVNTVKGYAGHEKDVLIGVTEARAKATSVNINAQSLTPENVKKFQEAQDGLTTSIARMMNIVQERYPDLKANQNFLDLQAQLEGTENRIAVERRNFNEAVQDYNTHIRSFPNNLFSGMFGFKPKGYFTAQAGADKAPEVKF